jgi:hypothetical protein
MNQVYDNDWLTPPDEVQARKAHYRNKRPRRADRSAAIPSHPGVVVD